MDSIDEIVRHVPRVLVDQLLSTESGPSPGSKHFNGALLLVDISGFTALSNQVSAETLKIIINEYFTIMIEKFMLFGGDVVKFAGDAIFVLWRESEHQSNIGACVTLAVACGMEICSLCNNRAVQTKPGKPPKWLPIPPLSPQKHVSILNVHSSISAGLMEGVDVGFLGRWEYLLLGHPVIDAGAVLDRARAGEFVLTKSAFVCLNDDEKEKYQCHDESYYALNSMLDAPPQRETVTRTGTGTGIGTASKSTDRLQWLTSFFSQTVTPFIGSPIAMRKGGETDEENEKARRSQADKAAAEVRARVEAVAQVLTGHVHEAARGTIGADTPSINFNNGRSHAGGAGIEHAEMRKIVTAFIGVNLDLAKCCGADEEQMEEKEGENKGEKPSVGDPGEASAGGQGDHDDGPFLVRTPTQRARDKALLDQLQNCMMIFTTALQSNGGQLRQFILDDKGCVCIATFGLRRSVSVDNCTAAVSCARTIVEQLHAVGLSARIGLGTGRAFCGLVGSASRHEFAVMGRSVNLAARLMCAAPMGAICCDAATREGDRLHSYVALGEKVAKGYSAPVAISRPIATTDLEVAPQAVTAIVSSRKVSYFARRNELNEVIAFLENASTSSPTTSSTTSSTDPSTKVVAVFANRGLGKCFFAKTLASKLLDMGRARAVFTAKATQTGSISQFDVWRQLLVAIVLSMGAGSAPPPPVPSPSPTRRSRLSVPNIKAGPDGWRDAVFFGSAVLTRLLERMSDKDAALVGAVLYPNMVSARDGGGAEDLDESGGALLALKVRALALLLHMLLDDMRARDPTDPCSEIILIIEEMHHMDNSSWLVLERAWRICRDVTIVCCCTPIATQSPELCEGSSLSDSILRSSVDSASLSAMRSRASASAELDVLPSSVAVLTKLQSLLFEDPRRGFQIYFGAFTQAATDNFVITLLQESFPNIQDAIKVQAGHSKKAREGVLHRSFLDLIYATSNGNPSYAAEITMAVAANSSSIGDLSDSLKSIMASLGSNKLDDWVLFQLDRLRPECQFLLKVASVAATHGASFTIDMLGDLVGAAGTGTGTDGLSADPAAFTPDALVSFMQEIMVKSSILSAAGEPEAEAMCSTAEGCVGIPLMPLMPSTPRAGGGAVDVGIIITSSTEFSFSSAERQTAIYNLMLTKQQEKLHECVARYLESEAASQPRLRTQASFWHALGVHWEKVSVWPKAMAAAYEVATILDAQGLALEAKLFACKAYNTLQTMKQEACVRSASFFTWSADEQKCIRSFDVLCSPSPRLVPTPTPSLSLSLRASPRLIDSNGVLMSPRSVDPHCLPLSPRRWSSEGSPALLPPLVVTQSVEARAGLQLAEMQRLTKTMTFATLYTLFRGDVLALEVAMMMMVRFFQMLITSMDDPAVTTSVLEETLELVLLASKAGAEAEAAMRAVVGPPITPVDRSRFLSSRIHKGIDYMARGGQHVTREFASQDGEPFEGQGRSRSDSTISGSRQSGHVEHFYLSEPTVMFRVLSGLGMQYVVRAVPSDTNGNQFATFTDTYVSAAVEFGDRVHELRALTFVVWRCNHCGDYVEAVEWAERIRGLYDFEAHSQLVIELFGSERVLQVLVLSVLHRALVGNIASATALYAYVHAKLALTKRLHTIATTTMTLVSLFLLLDMHEEAFECFLAYHNLELSSGTNSPLYKYNATKLYSLLLMTKLPIAEGVRRIGSGAGAAEVERAVWREVAHVTADPTKGSPKTPPKGSGASSCEYGGHTLGFVNPVITERCQPVTVQEIYGFGFDLAKANITFQWAKRLAAGGGEGGGSGGPVDPELLPCGRKGVLDLCVASLRFVGDSLGAAHPLDGLSVHRMHCLWLRAEVAAFVARLPIDDCRTHLDTFSIDVATGRMTPIARAEKAPPPRLLAQQSAPSITTTPRGSPGPGPGKHRFLDFEILSDTTDLMQLFSLIDDRADKSLTPTGTRRRGRSRTDSDIVPAEGQSQQQHQQQAACLAEAAAALRECEAMGRGARSPAVLLKTGLLLGPRLGLDAERGKALVREALALMAAGDDTPSSSPSPPPDQGSGGEGEGEGKGIADLWLAPLLMEAAALASSSSSSSSS